MATIRITSVGGVIVLDASLDSDFTFIVDADLIYSEGPFSGVGVLKGDSLLIEMNAENNILYEYRAKRQ